MESGSTSTWSTKPASATASYICTTASAPEHPPARRTASLESRTVSTTVMREPVQAPSEVRPARLVGASALMLLVELALIRWTGSNVLHLSYFSNFVLLGSFLGI